MSEKLQQDNTVTETSSTSTHHHHHSSSKSSSEHSGSHHHRHHHHSNSRHHNSHHSHHHHSSRSSGSGSRKNSFSISAKIKRIIRKITPDQVSRRAGASGSRTNEYALISRRVLFVAIIIIIFCYALWISTVEEEDNSLKSAGYTPSETSQLKSKVMVLEQEKAALQAELDRYKAEFGELPEEDSTASKK